MTLTIGGLTMMVVAAVVWRELVSLRKDHARIVALVEKYASARADVDPTSDQPTPGDS
jgi:hypothetical protein